MKNRIVAAAAAALMFAGCTDHSTDSKPVHQVSPVVQVVPVQPTAVAEEMTKKGAGSGMQQDAKVEPKPVEDGLALEHNHRGRVDHMARAMELKETGDFD